MLRYILVIGFLSILVACQNVRMLTPQEIYRPEFLAKVDMVQKAIRNNNRSQALAILNTMDEAKLDNQEKAKKYNLLGIVAFSDSNFERALKYFKMARENSTKDLSLNALINLNMASTYYKLGDDESTMTYLKDVGAEALSRDEKDKYFKLTYIVANKLGDRKTLMDALINLMVDAKSFQDIDNSSYREPLTDAYRALAPTERVYLLQKYEDKKMFVIGFLAKEEVLTRFYSGDKAGANDVLDWIRRYQGSSATMMEFVSDFEGRMKNYAQIDVGSIGILLPLTGEMGTYGKKALRGIEVVLNDKSRSLGLNAHVRDTMNNPVIARDQVQQLIINKHVSIIIGGLFPNTAREEYLEAKKYGVLYLSLSPVYLERERKDHMLIEVSGSIQSQVEKIFSPDFLEKFGHKVAMVYPESERGEVYLDEVWKRYKEMNVSITSIQSFQVNTKDYDYRNPVQKVLGLHYTRERQEEFDIWKEIYSLGKKSNIRRIQTLRPVVDFDWVFIPSYPLEAIQMIPSFSYFDASNLVFMGGPSWMSRTLMRERNGMSGTILMVGDDPDDFQKSFVDLYRSRYGTAPHLIETLGYESLNLAKKIVERAEIKSRDDLESSMRSTNKITGITGQWSLNNGIWIKDMDVLRVGRKKIYKESLVKVPEETN